MHKLRQALSLSVYCTLLAACAQKADVAPTENILAYDKEVSQADLRTAKLLSLSNNGALQTISDPYELSVSCIASIEVLSGQLRTMSAVTPDQLTALQAAVGVYRKRALESGKSPAELNQNIEEKRADGINFQQHTRTGLSCLRQLT